jgi:hypothetical protein
VGSGDRAVVVFEIYEKSSVRNENRNVGQEEAFTVYAPFAECFGIDVLVP